MKLGDKELDDRKVALLAHALSVHRTQVRRKIGRMQPGSPQRETAVQELREINDLLQDFNQADVAQLAS